MNFPSAKSLGAAAIATAFAALLGMGGSASAETWAQAHPRRAEVNHRLANQNQRINQERRAGEIAAKQAHALHRQDHFIRKEERFDAAQNHGHITKAERRSINQQENGVSHEIGH